MTTVAQQQRSGRKDFAQGTALIGLIPMAVGLAYIICYRGEDKRPRELS